MSNAQKEEQNADLHLALSEKYMKYKDLAERCLINEKNLDQGEKRVFYLKPSTIFLQEPRAQNQYRNEFIRQVVHPPQPEPLTYMADDLHRAFIEATQDKSNPEHIKNELCNFFKKRQYKLQHKTYKLLMRWAHYGQSTEKIDKTQIKFNPIYSKVQFELENAVKRQARLEGTDHFNTPDRPKQEEGTSYNDEGERPPLSALRADDIDVYFRIVTYEERVTRRVERFIQRVKWVPLSHRFQIYAESIEYFQNIRKKSLNKQKEELSKIEEKGNELIERKKLGEIGNKELQQILQSKTVNKLEKKQVNSRDIYLNSSKYNYEQPPMIIWNELDLKLHLFDLAAQHRIPNDMEADRGHQFSQCVVVYFPQIFRHQTIKNLFAPYDAVPSKIDPKNLGNKDIKKVLKRNQKKYGRTSGGNTLLEVLEIEKHSKALGVEFLNSVEKSLFGEFNNAQIADFPSVRVKYSDWVDLVCFEPKIDNDLMYQAAVLSGEKNIIDECLSNFLEILNVQDLANVNLVLESISQIHYDKAKYGSVKTDFLNFDPNDPDTFFTENQKQFLSLFKGCFKAKQDFDRSKPAQEISNSSLHEMPQHLLFANYLLDCLNAREQKVKLLYTLNTFRAIQRRITIELREMGTRDRVLGEAEVRFTRPIEPMTDGTLSTKSQSDVSGDDNEEKNVMQQSQNLLPDDNISITQDHLVDILKYRFQGKFKNFLQTTCPIIPKFHSTYGQPIERQEISQEIDNGQKNTDNRRTESKKFLGRIDKLYKHAETDLNLVRDDFGIHILYDATFADMRSMEMEILQICSFYINKAEPVFDNDLKNIYPSVDRLKILEEIINLENKFQEAKLDLCQCYLECYEHTTDILEQQKLIQAIVDEMAKRPKLNLSGTHFKDSYLAEIEYVRIKTNLIRDVMKMLMEDEFKVNTSIREYIEKSYRLIHEQMQGKFKEVDPEKIEDEINRRETIQTGVYGVRDAANDRLLDQEGGNPHKNKLDEVEMEIRRQRAITLASVVPSYNFASPQELAKLMQIPLKNLELIMKDHNERDHLVKQSLHEHVNFIKCSEGYPHYIYNNAKPNTQFKFNSKSQEINLLDFYEGLSIVPKVIAGIDIAFNELNQVHRPDNGFLTTCLQICTINHIRAELQVAKSFESGYLERPNNNAIINLEDDSIAGNPDYMLFAAKELASLKQNPNRAQNPFIISKLDLHSIREFDFTKYQGYIEPTTTLEQQEDKEKQKEQEIEKITKKDFGNFYSKVKYRAAQLNFPSMLVLTCNQVEMLRLRNTLLMTIEQAAILEDVYEAQVKLMSKEGKVRFKDPFNFQNYVIGGGENFINFIREGPADEIQVRLAINEFDPKLRNSVNFSDLEAVKAMMTPYGLEELRCVVEYELMNFQILIVAVRTNQILLDNCQRKLCEIEFFRNQYTVANPVLNVFELLQGQNLFANNIGKLPDIERRKVMQTITSNCGQLYYNILLRKSKMKETIEKIFKAVKTSTGQMASIYTQRGEDPPKIEVLQKYLRATKMVLCHDYCQDILGRVYCDSLKLQLMLETDTLRRRTYLLPKDSIFLEIFPPFYGEHQFAAYNEDHLLSTIGKEVPEFFSKTENRIQSFWRLPTNKEIFEIVIDFDSFKKINMPKNLVYELGVPSERTMPEFIQEDLLKIITQRVQKLDLIRNRIEVETVVKEKYRLIDFSSSYDYLSSGKLPYYLSYFKHISDIFDLDFFTNKLASSAQTIANIEKMVLSGVPFWEEGDEALLEDLGEEDQEEVESPKEQKNKLTNFQGQNQIQNIKKGKKDFDKNKFEEEGHRPLKNILASQVAEKIGQQKREKIQLLQDLESIKDQFKEYGTVMAKQEMGGSLARAVQYLQELHHIKFYGVLQILYQLQDNYFKENKGQKEIHFVNKVIQAMSHQQDLKVTFNNGFHVNFAITAIDRTPLDTSVYNQDYDSFIKLTQPVIDENALDPLEYNLVKGIYLATSINLVTYKKQLPYQGCLIPRDYSYLDYSLTNLNWQIRKYLMTNINSNEMIMKSFILAKNKQNEKEYQSNPTVYGQILNDKKNFLKIQVKARQARRILMIIRSKRLLPMDIEQFNEIYRSYDEDMKWKINQNVDTVIKARNAAAERETQSIMRQNPAGAIQNSMKQSKDSTVLKIYDSANAEIEAVQSELQKYMIRTSFATFDREAQALAKVFEMSNLKVLAFVHPCQQFASTFHQTVDNRNHLDIINKVGPIQKMLTQIKNRCLEIQTLTSGTGVVISAKDLNECLEECCRSLIKYGEIEMRTRCDHLLNQLLQYENLIYIKDRQLINLEGKLRSTKQELNKIVNTKVFSRGNSLIYELDMTQRQLRLLKDHIFLLEKNLTEKIKLCYETELAETKMRLNDKQKQFMEYQEKFYHIIQAGIRENLSNIDEIMLKKANFYKDLSNQTDRQIKFEEYKQSNSALLNTNITLDNMLISKDGQVSQAGVTTDPRLLAELESLKQNEGEARKEVLRLQDVIRKYRIMNKFKEILTAERHEFKIDNLKQQLTSNTTLWEQLAESEKREKILKQEIERAQQEIATQERIIERLKDDIKKEGREKQKLLQFKNTKSKRLNELESKAREFEVLSSVNLSKILQLLENKEKKINILQKNEDKVGDYVQAITKLNEQEIERIKARSTEETKAKLDAMNKLDSLRQELQMIQGNDTNSLNFWKEQCQSLFTICKNLKEDNERLVEGLTTQASINHAIPSQIQYEQDSYIQSPPNYVTPARDSLIPQRRGLSQQTGTKISEKNQSQYERMVYGMEKSLQDHMLGKKKAESQLPIIKMGRNLQQYETVKDPTIRTADYLMNDMENIVNDGARRAVNPRLIEPPSKLMKTLDVHRISQVKKKF